MYFVACRREYLCRRTTFSLLNDILFSRPCDRGHFFLPSTPCNECLASWSFLFNCNSCVPFHLIFHPRFRKACRDSIPFIFHFFFICIIRVVIYISIWISFHVAGVFFLVKLNRGLIVSFNFQVPCVTVNTFPLLLFFFTSVYVCFLSVVIFQAFLAKWDLGEIDASEKISFR